LIDLIPRRHYHQDIYVAIFVRRAVGVGAEQDDLLRMEVIGHLAGVAANDTHGYVCPAIPARRSAFSRFARFGSHAKIPKHLLARRARSSNPPARAAYTEGSTSRPAFFPVPQKPHAHVRSLDVVQQVPWQVAADGDAVVVVLLPVYFGVGAE